MVFSGNVAHRDLAILCCTPNLTASITELFFFPNSCVFFWPPHTAVCSSLQPFTWSITAIPCENSIFWLDQISYVDIPDVQHDVIFLACKVVASAAGRLQNMESRTCRLKAQAAETHASLFRTRSTTIFRRLPHALAIIISFTVVHISSSSHHSFPSPQFCHHCVVISYVLLARHSSHHLNMHLMRLHVLLELHLQLGI